MHPWMKGIYADVFAFQQNPERLVDMYSKALEIMDPNTVRFMIEEQKQELEEQQQELEERKQEIEERKQEIEGQKKALEEKDKTIEQLQKQIEELKVSKKV